MKNTNAYAIVVAAALMISRPPQFAQFSIYIVEENVDEEMKENMKKS